MFQSVKRFAFVALLSTTPCALLSQAVYAESSWSAIQKKGVLRCGAAVGDPHVMRDPRTGQYSGSFVDLCRDFGENVLKVKVEMVDTTWETIVAGLQSNKWDIGMAMNSTPERALAVTFSRQVTDYQVSFSMHKDNPKLAGLGDNPADYDKADITIAVMSGTPQDKAVSSRFKQAKVMRLTELDATRLALMSKRADVLADDNSSNRLFTLSSDWVREVYPKPALAKYGLSFGLSRDMSAADIKVLDLYLVHRQDLGEIDELIDKAIKEAEQRTAAQ